MDVDFLLPSDPTEDLDGDREMYEWFLSQKSWRLPQPPFWVNEWTRVTGPLFYYLTEREAQSSLAYLKGEISKPNARHMTGALQLTIRRVRELQQEAFECAELANQLTLICQLDQQKSDRDLPPSSIATPSLDQLTVPLANNGVPLREPTAG